jgi:hypothetical protein
MDLDEALKRIFEPSAVTFHSTPNLVGAVKKRVAKIDADREKKLLPPIGRKSELAPVPKHEHKGQMLITPWELLHTQI